MKANLDASIDPRMNDEPDQQPITCQQLGSSLENMGIRAGAAIVVHSSLKSFGQVEGGPGAVVDALIRTVGPEGCVIMPVYASSLDQNGDLLRRPAPQTRVSTGLIAATFGQDARTVLSSHPIYAYAYYGRDARDLARKTETLMTPYGPDQPLMHLFQRQGHIVQLGVDDRTNTSIHVAEELADPPYLAGKKSASSLTVEAFFLLPPEQRRDIIVKHRSGPRRNFRLCSPLIEAAGLRRSAWVGQALVTVTEFSGMCRLLIDTLRHNPRFMIETDR